jgi:hypothetical protein
MTKKLIIAAALCFLVGGVLAVPLPGPKLMCPVCKDEIKPGDFTCNMMIRAELVPVHFKHGFDWGWGEKVKGLRE